MQRRLAYKFRLNPSTAQAKQLMGMCYATRFTWNWALSQHKAWYEAAHETYSWAANQAEKEVNFIEEHSDFKLCATSRKALKRDFMNNYVDLDLKPQRFQLSRQLKFLKKQYPWLAEECESSSLGDVLESLEKAYEKFWKQPDAGHPRFKKSNRKKESIEPLDLSFSVVGSTCTSAVRLLKLNKSWRVRLPKIRHSIHLRLHRQLEGKIKTATISFNGFHWFISFSTVEEIDEPLHASKSAIGVDLGITKSAALSNGKIYPASHIYKKNACALKKTQKKFARAKIGGKNRERLKKRLRRKYLRMRNQRNNHIHEITTDICDSHATIVIEDLKSKNMSSSAKGTIEEPGKKVKQKSGLNRELLDASFFEYRRQLEYKSKYQGGRLIVVDPKYTSQTCSRCGHVEKDNRKTQATFECQKCGYRKNADINAAQNILKRGLDAIKTGDV